jgi:hypothetical protein
VTLSEERLKYSDVSRDLESAVKNAPQRLFSALLKSWD